MPVSSPEESIFCAAIQLGDAAARTAYVAGACGPDARLRQRVEALLSAYGSGEFLEAPAADLVATALLPPIGERPGDQIGSYKLLEQIGEGGMGLVFMAEQSRPLRRRVALKIIKPGLDTRAVIARFEAERQALALMDHPNIARVFDAGATESGRPYFVMELVRGQPITDYCRDRGLALRERLDLFMTVCDAVQHAHQKGVIHRDLKPTNILVAQTDTAPVPKVIDFGVAKATASQSLTDKTLFTAFSQIIGTPLYMSPEQADLGNQDVDTRSDVYSLGVVLYELLTSTTPFDAERLRSVSHDEMRRIIREEEPPKPSTRATTGAVSLSTVATKLPMARRSRACALRGDLDWIVMKALEKDRRRRYESPGVFAADIKRFLAGLPVLAQSGRFWYRTRKYVGRHWLAMLILAGVALSLISGIAVALSGWRRAASLNTELVGLLSERDDAVRQATNARQVAVMERNRASDAYTELADRAAFLSDGRGDVAEAALWFAHSARQRAGAADKQSSDESNYRAAAWLAASISPIAAFKHVGAMPVQLTLTDNGRFLSLLDASGRHAIWDVAKQKEVDLAFSEKSVAALCVTGEYCAHTANNGRVDVYQPSNLARLAQIAVDGPVSAMTFSHDGRYLAIAASRLMVWDCKTRRLLDGSNGTAPSLNYLAFDPSSTSLLASEADGQITVVQIRDGHVDRSSTRFPVKHVMDTHSWGENPVMPLITADSVIVRTGDNALEAYSLSSGKLIWQCPARWRIGSVSQNRSGESVVLTGKEAQVWRVGERSPMRTIVGHQDTILATALSSDGGRLVTGGLDSEANFWRPMQEYMLRTRVYHEGHVTAVAIAEERQELFATAQIDGLVRVWKTAFPTPLRTIPLPTQCQVIVSRDGRYIMTGGSLYWERKLQAAQVFDAATGKFAGPPLHPGGLVNGATFSPDGTQAVTLSTLPENAGLTSYQLVDWENKPGLVTVWNWKTGDRQVEWSTPSEPVDAEYLPTKGQMVVVCAAGEVLVADSETGDVLRKMDHGAHATLMWTSPKRRLVVAPQGDRVATLGLGNVVKVWSSRDGQLLCSGSHDDHVRDAKFSLDGRWLVSASMDNTARVWDCRSGEELARLQHADWVMSATFNVDGTKVLTASRDQTARVWNWANGAEELVLSHQDMVADAAFVSAGKIIATITEDGHACFWSSRSGKLIAPSARGSYWGHSLAIAGGGSYVVIGTGEREVPVFDLHGIPDLQSSHDRPSIEELESAAELLSGRRLKHGETIGMTSGEWMERWESIDHSQLRRLLDANPEGPPETSDR